MASCLNSFSLAVSNCSNVPVTGSPGVSSRCTHSCITCTSRNAPNWRNRSFPAFFMSFQARSGSIAAIPSAMEQQRRRATRRSCTGSGANAMLARSHSCSTRRIQKARPACFFRDIVRTVAVSNTSTSRITSVMCIFSCFALHLAGTNLLREPRILTADTNKGNRIASARAFVHSLNILVKYARLYGFDHKRTEGQFAITWNELQEGLPKGPDGSFLLGVSENKLLLDGIPLETGQAERSFAQLLTTAGLASIHFSNQITKDEFIHLIRAFALGGSRAQDVIKEIKSTFGDSKNASIRINEVRFVAADPSTGEVSMAAQIAAQSLGP